MYRRFCAQRIEAALADTPVVFLNGARQTGKTTLVRALAAERPGATYLTLDDAGTLAAAVSDPGGFLRNLTGLVIIDEVQKAPALFPAIKIAVDGDRRPGRFLLTGSSNVLLLPRLSESLAGRMEIIPLWPFSQGELEGTPKSFAERLRRPVPFAAGRVGSPDPPLSQRILRGGFPEAVARRDPGRRREWFGAYLTAVLERDVRDLAHIEGLTDMPRLLALLASRAGGLLNLAEVSRGVGIPHATLRRYMTLLEATYLVRPVRAWSADLGRRLVRAPKVHLCDTGLLTYLLHVESEERFAASPQRGACFENFVLAELLKQASFSPRPFTLWHFRTSAGLEVDLVLEWADGDLSGIEVKASTNLSADDFRGLRALGALLGPRFRTGVVLYAGDTVLPFGDRLWGVPVSSMWSE